ncbi:unnamed protein product [Symbiodinium sp. CCMP2592]|nr:unnamed protein product [Symbiodinium sp. CCMP2592]
MAELSAVHAHGDPGSFRDLSQPEMQKLVADDVELFLLTSPFASLVNHCWQQDWSSMQAELPLYACFDINQADPSIGPNSSVSCTVNCLLFCSAWYKHPNPDFICRWLEQPWDEAPVLRSLLKEGAALMSEYLAVVRERQQAELNIELDMYTLPEEVQHEVLHGHLRDSPRWNCLRPFLTDATFSHIACGVKLQEATELALGHRLSLTRLQSAAYFFVCNHKSFVVVGCGHQSSGCALLLFDSHGLSLQATECSGSALCRDAEQVLEYLCRHGEHSLYGPNQVTQLYASVFEGTATSCQACRAPASELLRSVRSMTSRPGDGAGLSVKPEAAPTFGMPLSSCFPESLIVLEPPSESPVGTPPRKVPRVAGSETTHAASEALVKKEAADSNMDIDPPEFQEAATEDVKMEVKTEPACDGDADEEVPLTALVGQPPAKLSGAQASKKPTKEEKLLLKKADAMLAAYGTGFPAWFKVHSFHGVKGHWNQFKLKLAADSIGSLGCRSCSTFFRSLDASKVQQQQQLVVPSEGDEVPAGEVVLLDPAALKPQQPRSKITGAERLEVLKREEGVGPVPKGPSGTAIKDVGASSLVEVDAKRDSTIHFLLQHECYDMHWTRAHSDEIPRQCRGVKIIPRSESSQEYHIETCTRSLQVWMGLDFPWSGQQSLPHGCYMETVDSEVICWVRCRPCQTSPAVLQPGEDACVNCRKLANKEAFASKVASWVYLVDLLCLLHATYAAVRKERREALQALGSADYRRVLSCHSVAQLETMTWPELHQVVRQQAPVTTPAAFQNSAALNLLRTRFQWLPTTVNKDAINKLDRQHLQKHLEFLVGQETEAGFTCMLSEELRQGRLDSMECCRVLMSCLATRLRLLSANQKRLTTSHVQGVTDAQLQDVGFFLASISSTSQLMELFGLNPRELNKPPSFDEALPDFFCASAEEPEQAGMRSTLFRNLQTTIGILGVAQSRSWVLSFDETVTWPAYGIYNSRSHGRCYVGGGDEMSMLPCSDHYASDLKKENLAQCVFAVLVKRVETFRHPYCVLLQPRRLKAITSQSNLCKIGKLWELAAECNGGIPPLASSHDNATTQVVFSEVMLGLVPLERLADVPPPDC